MAKKKLSKGAILLKGPKGVLIQLILKMEDQRREFINQVIDILILLTAKDFRKIGFIRIEKGKVFMMT